MSHRWEAEIERQRETPEKEWEKQEIEQRLLEAQEVKHKSTQMPEQPVSDAAVLRREAKHLNCSEFRPEVEAEARLMQTEDRLDSAVQRLMQIEGLRPELWQQMDVRQRAWTLRRAGRELGKVYHHPTPPLLETDMGDPQLLGSYGDGYRFDRWTGGVVGADYGVRMNTAAELDHTKLFGDDPKVALHTYAHEFRHSYQCEQATRWEKPQFRHLVDDPDQAMRWSSNIRDYKEPPDDKLREIDPERHKREKEAYRKQLVEEDAEYFADELVKRVYGQA